MRAKPGKTKPRTTRQLPILPPALPRTSRSLTRRPTCAPPGREGRRARHVMDEDLNRMSREELIAEAKKLRQGIRVHRDSTGHDLCWHHPALWGLLPDKQDPLPTVPAWPEFLRGCLRYRQSLDDQLPKVPRSHEEHRG